MSQSRASHEPHLSLDVLDNSPQRIWQRSATNLVERLEVITAIKEEGELPTREWRS